MKLSLVTALAHHPRLLVLDEATSGLDPVVRGEILDLFLDFIQDEDHSILISSHITSDLKQVALCDKPMLFIHGTLDDFIPFEMLDELYNAKPGDDNLKLVAEDTGHGEAMYDPGDTYWDMVFDFADA